MCDTFMVFFKVSLWTSNWIFSLTFSLFLCRFVSPTRVAALGLASGIILVLLLFCLYKVFCPKNYGQNGISHSRRKRGDLPCDDYGYSPPETEIVPLVLRGHLMVGPREDGSGLHKKGILLTCAAHLLFSWVII